MGGVQKLGLTGAAILLGLLTLILPAGGIASDAPTGTTSLDVRFVGQAAVRGESDELRAADEETLGQLSDLLDEVDATWAEPLVAGMTQAEAGSNAREARSRSGSPTRNMANWYRVTVATEDVPEAFAALRSSPLVSAVSESPEPVRPPSTPDFSPLQNYLAPAPGGNGARAMAGDRRVLGDGVTVVDLEYYWTRSHEDLQLPASTDMGAPSFVQFPNFDDEHGTAVFGIMVAKDNGFGVTGGVPEATMRGISPMTDSMSYNPAGALSFLADKLAPGDVVLIEQQVVGPAGGTAFVPLEWDQASFDAMKQLNDLGIVVVETGGNGSQNLDGANMLGRFDRNVRDSGAIIVGGGHPVTREALDYTSRGSRMDLQGHGQYIVTTGGSGDLQGSAPADRNIRYTDSFSGTSGAAPIVANAVVAVQSYLKATGQAPYTAAQISQLLKETGTPQGNPAGGLIGPLPDIRKALREIETDPPLVSASASGGKLTLTADDGWGRGVDSIEFRLDEGPWLEYTVPVTIGNSFQADYRATDLNGNTSVTERIDFDTVRPTARIMSPADGANLVFGAELPLVYGCSDDDSGIATCEATVSGPGGNSTLTSGALLPTKRSGLHTISVTATDRGGLTATATATYTVGPGCLVRGAHLAGAESRGGNVRVTGVVDASKAGSWSRVLRSGRQVGRAKVKADGTITATVRAPASTKARNRARYSLSVAGSRSRALPAGAAVRVLSKRSAPNRFSLNARLTGTRAAGKSTVITRPLCGGSVSRQRVRFDRRGKLSLRLGYRPGPQVVTLLAGKRNLNVPVVVPASRFANRR